MSFKSDEIFDELIHVNWYNWNENNKKTFLILLTNADQILKFKYSENISLNYIMGLQVKVIRYFFYVRM